MLNLKKNLYIAIALALCALYACSSDNPSSAGSTTIPNATADNDSIVFEGDKPIIPELIELRGDQDTAFYSKLTAFETEPTSLSSDMDSLDVMLYDKENGASATCSAGDQSFDAKFKMEARYGYIFKTLTMHNVGAACDSILQEFQDVCNTNPKIIVHGGYSGFCTSTGDLYAFCADLSHLTLECSEPEADGTKKCHVKRDSTTALDTNRFIQDFVKKSESVCTDISTGKLDVSDYDPIEDYWTPGHNPIDHLDTSNKGEPIDTAAFTLEKYAEQFADVSEGISFDSLVLAYRILPTSEIVLDTGSYTIREPSPAEVAKYFPMTTAITGENFNSEHCDIYTVAISGSQFLAIILTHIEYEYVKYALIFADGDCKKGDDFAQIFLIKDCTGEFDEYAVTSADGDIFENTPWTCDENGVPPGRENGPYGEWYRADLRQ
ncbi:MAG: hypothetical protein IKP90_00695 [Fibrobacter sp.]|nr:hypothetical protein [Fibrobacter sp.]